jgi:hypothetical protein
VAHLTVVYGAGVRSKNLRFVVIRKDLINTDPFACAGYGTGRGDALNEFSSGYLHLLIYLKCVFAT